MFRWGWGVLGTSSPGLRTSVEKETLDLKEHCSLEEFERLNLWNSEKSFSPLEMYTLLHLLPQPAWFCFCLLSFTAPVMQTCSINERNERSNHQELRAKCLSQGLLGGKKFTCISVMWETQYQKVMLIKMRIFYLQVSKSILMSFLTEWTYII